MDVSRGDQADALAVLETIGSLNALLSTVKDAETGQRGYLLTEDARYLDPYRHALTDLRAEESALRSLTLSRRLPSKDVDAIIELIDDKLDELEETIRT